MEPRAALRHDARPKKNHIGSAIQEQDVAIDEAKPNVFMENFVRDVDAAMHAATAVVGDRPGLHKARAGQPPFNLIFEARP